MSEIKKLEDFLVPELDAELEGYKAAGLEVPKEVEDGVKAVKIEFITKARIEHGVPHVIAEEEVSETGANGLKFSLEDGIKVGDTVLIPFTVEVAKAPEGDKAPTPPAPEVKKEEETKTAAAPSAEKPQYINRRLILSVSNKLNNGRLYKEVICADASYLLTEEEFNQQVKNSK